MKQVMLLTTTSIIAVIAALVIVLLVEDTHQPSVSVIQQPQREKYVPPEWVVNERGQKCIKQGSTVTCG